MKKALFLLFIGIFLFIDTSLFAYQIATSFIFPVQSYTQNDGCLEWGGYNSAFPGKRHVADDYCCSVDTDIKSSGKGRVKYVLDDPDNTTGYGWYAIVVIEHTLNDGSKICSIYGHVKPLANIAAGTEIDDINTIVGKVIEYPPSDNHIHFGVYNGQFGATEGTYPSWLHGYLLEHEWPGQYIDPVGFVKSHQSLINNIFTALIIDSSGSMTSNDLLNNRLEAARFFVDRAEDDDYITVIDFDSTAKMLALERVRDHRDALRSAVDAVDSSGGTDIGAGLRAGYDALLGIPLRLDRIAILLTDGDGGYNGEADLYKAQGWKVFTVGLGEEVDRTLLQQIAAETGGKYFEISAQETAENVITKIYGEINREIHRSGETILQEEVIVPSGGIIERVFEVVRDALSLWVDRIIPGSDVVMSLIQPDGTVVDRNVQNPQIYHALGRTYEIYRIDNPMPGKWTVKLAGTDTPPEGEPTSLTVSITVPPEIMEDDISTMYQLLLE